MKGFFEKIHSYFQVSERNTTILKEVFAGIISFLPMIYILPLVSSVLFSIGIDESAAFLATAFSSALACLLVGLLIKKPLIQSVGLGMNAFFAYTICGELGYNWQEGLTIIFVSSLLFLILSITPLRKKIINAITKEIRLAISIGLGGFLIYSGLRSAGIIIVNEKLSLGNFTSPIVILAILGTILAIILMNLKGKINTYAIIIGMMFVVVVGYILNLLGVKNMPHFKEGIIDFSSLKDTSLVFLKNFSIFKDAKTYMVIFIFTFMSIFDTGTGLLAFEKDLELSDEFGNLKDEKKLFLPDSVASIIATSLGTTTITTFAESKISIESGAKTGISSIVVGIMFLLSIFLYPIFTIFSGIEIAGITYNPIVSVGVISIGVLLVSRLKEVNWKDCIGAASTIIMLGGMILLYSIPNGFGIGIIIYVILKVIFKKGKEISSILYLIAFIFVLYFIIILVL